MSSNFDEDASRRTAQAPYSSHKKVPNVPDYREHQKQRKADAEVSLSDDDRGEVSDEASPGVIDSLKSRLHLQSPADSKSSSSKPAYTSQNRNIEEPASDDGSAQREGGEVPEEALQGQSAGAQKGNDSGDTIQSAAAELDPRRKRKNMKHMKRDDAGREVTDPVTHLPVFIHDSTNKELNSVPENEPPPDSEPRTSTSLSKSETQLHKEMEEEQAQHRGMEKLFPPPNYDVARERLAKTYRLALTVGLGSLFVVLLLILVGMHVFTGVRSKPSETNILPLLFSSALLLLVGLAVGGCLVWGLQDWIRIQVQNVWDEEVWEAAKIAEKETAESPTPESTQWLNSLLSSIWSLINPDLFTSLADTLEDVMQASLPKFVRMVSVEDLGQGSESIRILGVRWLPTGAAAKDVSVDGQVKSGDEQRESDRKVPGEGEVDDGTESGKNGDKDISTKAENGDNQQQEGQDENIAEGLEAEEGDFVNIEVAFSYRASNSGKDMKVKARNAHLYLAFYLPSKIRLPVWVELRGIVGTMRLRLQLCPDPPFFALCTLTLLGQPKADLSCVPLVKKGLNLMNLPLISSFVQSSIDAALAEYVAPKSLTLDLKDMLVGDDFKKDTVTRGVLVIRIKEAKDFKEGDPGSIMNSGSTDGYVTAGWAKFGKPVW